MQLDAINDVVAALETALPGYKIERAQSEGQVDKLQTSSSPTIIVYPGRRIAHPSRRYGFPFHDSQNHIILQLTAKDPEIYDLCRTVERTLSGLTLTSFNSDVLRWVDENLKDVKTDYLSFIQQYTYMASAAD